MKSLMTTLFMAVFIFSQPAVYATHSSPDTELRLGVFPVECLLEDVETGTNTVTQITPENCKEILYGSPGGPDEGSGQHLVIDNLAGSPSRQFPRLIDEDPQFSSVNINPEVDLSGIGALWDPTFALLIALPALFIFNFVLVGSRLTAALRRVVVAIFGFLFR